MGRLSALTEDAVLRDFSLVVQKPAVVLKPGKTLVGDLSSTDPVFSVSMESSSEPFLHAGLVPYDYKRFWGGKLATRGQSGHAVVRDSTSERGRDSALNAAHISPLSLHKPRP